MNGVYPNELLICEVRNFARFCIHEFLDFFFVLIMLLNIMLGAFISGDKFGQIRVMIGKNDINDIDSMSCIDQSTLYLFNPKWIVDISCLSILWIITKNILKTEIGIRVENKKDKTRMQKRAKFRDPHSMNKNTSNNANLSVC